jgi:hypothetical protein
MKSYTLVTIHFLFAAVLAMVACSGSKAGKIKGEWRSKDNETLLKITGKQFTMDTDSPIPEDYFMKGDTIYTSFQGNLPYTKFVVKEVDEHNLKLLYPDSVLVEFTR